MASLRHHSPSSDHEHLLRDFQGQGNDHERQKEDLSSAENDKASEDGREKEGIHIYPRWLPRRSPPVNLEDIKSEHQNPPHLSASWIGGTKKGSPYHYCSVPYLDIEVRSFVYMRLNFPPPPPTPQLPSIEIPYWSIPLSAVHFHRHFPSSRRFCCLPPSLLL